MLKELSHHIRPKHDEKRVSVKKRGVSVVPAESQMSVNHPPRRRNRRSTLAKAKRKFNKALTWREQHLYFYYYNYTDFIVMRWLRNPLMYALWVTVCSTYTVTQCLESIITRPDEVKQKIEITYWGFYALTLRFIITAINSWRYVRKFGITTLPITEEEEVVVYETIVDEDDPHSTTTNSSLFSSDVNAELTKDYIRYRDHDKNQEEEKDREDLHKLLTKLYSAVKSKDIKSSIFTEKTPYTMSPDYGSRSNSVFDEEKSPNEDKKNNKKNRKEERERGDLQKLMTKLYSAVKLKDTKPGSLKEKITPRLMSPIPESRNSAHNINENRKDVCLVMCKNNILCKCPANKSDQELSNIYAMSNYSTVRPEIKYNPISENTLCQQDAAETNFPRSDHPQSTGDRRFKKCCNNDKHRNFILKNNINHQSYQRECHKGHMKRKFSPQNTNMNSPASQKNIDIRTPLPKMSTEYFLAKVKESVKSSIISSRREAMYVERQSRLIQVGSQEYLSDIESQKENKRCCACCRFGKAKPFQRKVSVPVIGACQYGDGTAGHFVVKSLKRKKRLKKLSMLLATQWVLQNISNNMAFVVSSVYWLNQLLASLDIPGWEQTETKGESLWRAINNAVFNMVFATVDMNLSSAPVRMAHVWMPMVFFLVYTGFTWIFWYVGGRNQEGKTYIYEFLDWGEQPWRALLFLVLVAFVIIPAAQFVIYLLFRFREYIFYHIHKVKKRVVKHIRKRRTMGQKQFSFTAYTDSISNGSQPSSLEY